MSNWLLWSAEHLLRPVYDQLHKELLKRDVLHADETTLQVLHEPGKPAQSKSYMWLYRTSGDTNSPIVLYEYLSLIHILPSSLPWGVQYKHGRSRYMEAKLNQSPLETEPIPKLIVRYSVPVSYTHLDVYKRQGLCGPVSPAQHPTRGR